MLRKLLTFSVVLAASITLSSIRITAQRNVAPPNVASQPDRSQPSEAQTKQPDNERNNTNQGTSATQQPAPATQIVNSFNNPPPPAATKQSKVQQFLDNLQTDPIVLITVLIAFFAGWQVLIYRDMRHHNVIIERAYLTVGEWTMTGFEPKGVIDVHYHLFNGGKTTATVIESLQRIGILERLPDVPEYTAGQRDPDIEIAGLHPASKRLHMGTKLLSPEAHQLILDGKYFLFIWGYVRYRDIFKKTHTKRFGWVYSTQIGGFVWVDNPAYNRHTDDD